MDYDLINRAIVMDLWSLTDHTKITRQEFLDAIAHIQQQAQERDGEIARLREALKVTHDMLGEATAALDRVLLAMTGCSPGEFDTYMQTAERIIAVIEAKPEAPAHVSAATCKESLQVPESPAPVAECAARKALELALSMIDQNYPVAAAVDDCRAALATPCPCTEPWEESESDKWKQLDIAVSDNGRLRAELAAANERAERAETARKHTQDWYGSRWQRMHEYFRTPEMKGTKVANDWFSIVANGGLLEGEPPVCFMAQVNTTRYRLEEAERQRDTAQAGWKEAVEGLRIVLAIGGYLPGPVIKSSVVQSIRDARATIARFDAQGGVK